MATSPFKRLYHSVAMLLPDASVLVAGSEQGAWFFCTPQRLAAGGRFALTQQAADSAYVIQSQKACVVI
jgi:hypothetical protein